MTVDKRTVHTDALETLGNIITENEQRDAIHLAVEPCKNSDGTPLFPGQHVALVSPRHASSGGDKVGIVDPFLFNHVLPGEWFWLVVYPRQITSLRHVWEHPSFNHSVPDTPAMTPDAEWIWFFAQECGITYDVLMDGAKDYLDHSEYLNFGPLLEGITVPNEFWDRYERVTGKTILGGERGSFFSCAC